MDIVLTGRTIGAAEAKAVGLVARVVPSGDLLQVALEAAHTVAGYNAPAVKMVKEAVNRAKDPFRKGCGMNVFCFRQRLRSKGRRKV